uniref:Uncharacterized protein n=1 Tax=Physcomitrium patens TaxID=3218 RepID=A0A2K1KK73_PHYPA|nr:hypothetical protein PHYPA_007857 [Physcomitrium patens]
MAVASSLIGVWAALDPCPCLVFFVFYRLQVLRCFRCISLRCVLLHQGALCVFFTFSSVTCSVLFFGPHTPWSTWGTLRRRSSFFSQTVHAAAWLSTSDQWLRPGLA